MTVSELIEVLQVMPQNAKIVKLIKQGVQSNIQEILPEQVWDDDSENYVVVL